MKPRLTAAQTCQTAIAFAASHPEVSVVDLAARIGIRRETLYHASKLGITCQHGITAVTLLQSEIGMSLEDRGLLLEEHNTEFVTVHLSDFEMLLRSFLGLKK